MNEQVVSDSRDETFDCLSYSGKSRQLPAPSPYKLRNLALVATKRKGTAKTECPTGNLCKKQLDLQILCFCLPS